MLTIHQPTSYDNSPPDATRCDSRRALWRHIYGDGGEDQYISVFSGVRVAGEKKLQKEQVRHYLWPEEADKASAWLDAKSHEGREVYTCAHLVLALPGDDGIRRPRRKKEHAAPIWALYVDGDGATVPDQLPQPTAVIRSSPGRKQFYWRLTRPVSPAIGEQLNRRLAYAMRADLSGWDLTQLLRPPGTPNRKYPDGPIVTLAYLDDSTAYDPDELDRILPAAPAASVGRSHDAVDSGDAPPVDTITGSDLALWHGETPARHDDGQVDRSRTLHRIGKMLHRHGITEPWIVAALSERDQSLGLLRYVERPEEYRRIAGKVCEHPRLHIPADPLAAARDTDARVVALEAEIVILKAQVEQLRDRAERAEELQRLTVEVLRNPDLKNMKATALAVVFTVGGLETSGSVGDYREITPDGFINVRRAELASKAGVKEDAITRHVTRLESIGILEKRVRRDKKIDRETGEILTDPATGATLYDSKLQIKMSGDTRDVLRRLAAPLEAEHKSGWGGERQRPDPCPEHPDAAINVYRVLECAECETEIGRTLIDRHPARSAAASDSDPTIVFGQEQQDAVSEPSPVLVDSVLRDSKMRFQETGPRTCRYCPSPLYLSDSIERGTCALHAAGGAD